MPTLSVMQYRCFAADRRMSMDIYADSLALALSHSKLEFASYQPASYFEKYARNSMVMRFLRYWQYPRAISKAQADIHHILDHGYAHLQPRLSAGKSCVTVHDLIPLLNWKGAFDTFGTGQAPRKPWLNIRSLSYLKHFDQIVAVSQSTKNDLLEHLALSPNRIDVIPPIIPSHFEPIDKRLVSEFADKYQLSRDSHWIMISGQEFYKNHAASLRVLQHLCDTSEGDFRLIKTGFASPEFNALLDQYDLGTKVTQLFLEDVKEMALLYNFVDCLLFPSFYEGFGMPVAEALGCGTPVVSSDRASLAEVGGELSLRCKPDDIEGLAAAVMTSTHDKGYRDTVKSECEPWLRQFRAPAIAQKFETLYSELVSGS